MNTRTITGTIFHASGAAWASAVVRFRLLRRFVSADGVAPPDRVSITCEANGTFSTALAVPDDGTAAYEITLPDGAATVVYLAAGSAIDLSVLLASSSASVEPSALAVEAGLRAAADATLQTAITAEASARASADTARYTKTEADALLALKAPLASPAFTGTPTAPTQIGSDSSTRLATTAFVAAALATLVNNSPAALDTLNELAAALGNDPAFATTISTALGNRLRYDAAQSLSGAQKTQVQTNAGLLIGTDVQAWDAELAALAGLVSAANKLIYFTGSGSAATADLTAFARTLLDDTSQSEMLATLGVNSAPTLTEYTTTTADTLPAGFTLVWWDLWSAGHGGGSGRRGASGTNRYGGGGGGGGAFTRSAFFKIADLGGAGAAVTQTIGAGGTGGAAVTTDNTDGNAGSAGGGSLISITNKLTINASGGTGGGGGTATGSTAGGGAGSALFSGSNGSAGSNSAGTVGNSGISAGSGGGGGGGLNTSDTTAAGGDARFGAIFIGGDGGNTPNIGGTAGGGNGSNATSSRAAALLPVSSGSGGGSNNAGAGGAGGNGGRGCGGGGGGASQNGSASGKGGDGGPGYIRRHVM